MGTVTGTSRCWSYLDTWTWRPSPPPAWPGPVTGQHLTVRKTYLLRKVTFFVLLNTLCPFLCFYVALGFTFHLKFFFKILKTGL